MKILHIIDSAGLYGAENMLLNLAVEQMKQGLQPTIASIGVPEITEKAVERGAEVRGIPVQKFRMKAGFSIRGVYQILSYIRQHGFQLLHSHGYKGDILFGILPRAMRRIPLVATIHGYTSNTGLSKMRIYEWLDSWILRRLDAVVLVSNEMAIHPFLRKNKKMHYYVINNGIPVDESVRSVLPGQLVFSSPEDRIIQDFCREGIVIGSIGRFSKEKGYDLLVQVFSEIRTEKKEVKLVLIGEGGERGKLERKARELGVASAVLLAGYHQNAKRFMALMDVYVISSYTEGLPITLLEAMQARVPVVATSVGGIPEVLKDGACGLLVPPGQLQQLKEAINTVLANSVLAESLVKKAYERFVGTYSADSMAQQYTNLYGRVLS